MSETFLRFWETVYERSDTASTIINRAFQDVTDRSRACSVDFEGEFPHAEDSGITFIDEVTLGQLQYTSPRGTEPFRRNRMWIHEAVHWLTSTLDPLLHEANEHRGATVFLTGRILDELGDFPPVLPRTAYGVPPALSPAPETPFDAKLWGRTLRKINDWTALENAYLDQLLDEQRQFPASMHLFGSPVAQRITVRQILALDGYLSTLGEMAPSNGARIFDLIGDAFLAPPPLHFRSKLRTLVMQSDIFRKLAAAWNTKLRLTPIKIEMEAFDTHYKLFDDSTPDAFHILQDDQAILLYQEPIYYFSTYGTEMMGPMRKFVSALIDLFLGELTPNAHHLPMPYPFYNRGAGVMLENLILQQIGDKSVHRICKALTRNPEAYLASHSTIARAAISEDGYLKHTLNAKPPGRVDKGDLAAGDVASEGVCQNFLCILGERRGKATF